MPHKISPKKDEWDWSSIDEILRKAENDGVHAIIRFAFSAPGWGDYVKSPSGGKTRVPEWIVKNKDHKDVDSKVKDYPSYAEWDLPDWSNPTLQAFYKELMTKYAERYANNRVLFKTQGFFGNWGEGHYWPSDESKLQPVGRFPTMDYITEFFQHIDSEFRPRGMDWGVGIIASEWSRGAIDALPDLQFGSYDDTFHDDNAYKWNNELHTYMNDYTKRYKYSPLGGEISFSSGVRDDALDKNEAEFQKRTKLYRTTYMFYDGAEGHTSDKDKILENAIKLGYSLEIQAIEVDTYKGTTTFLIKNTGIAPVYKDLYIYIGEVIHSTDSLKYLQIDEAKSITVNGLLMHNAKDEISIKSDWCLNGETVPYNADVFITTVSD